jgi:hypothetical protein
LEGVPLALSDAAHLLECTLGGEVSSSIDEQQVVQAMTIAVRERLRVAQRKRESADRVASFETAL